MAQSVITKAFEKWNALNVLDGIASRPDKFVFALVPNQDATKPIDREEKIPPAAQIKHKADITQYGLLNENAVVYSCVLDTSIGDFDYNWIGLIDSKSNTVLMIVHVATQSKIKTQGGVQGNNLTRNFSMEFDGAAEATQINITAETWQIDFSARLFGIDEQHRLANVDIYGDGAFFDKGFLVEKTGSQFFITAGLAYIGGLRTVLATNQNLTISTKPNKIFVDSCFIGTVTGKWSVKTKVVVSNSLTNYIDATGVQHYVCAVASIDVAGNLTDLRRQGTNDSRYNETRFSKKDHDHDRNYLSLNGGEISGKVLFGVKAPTIPIHFVQEKETASYHQYSKLAGTLRAIYGIISDGLDIPFVIGRYDENGNSASRLYLNTDGSVSLNNSKIGANLTIGNDGKLKFKDVELANVNHNHDKVYAKASHSHIISDVTNLQSTLDSKASSTHNHDNVYAKASHSHIISDVTNLQSTLDSKASSTHNHDNVYAKILHSHNYLPLAGGEISGKVLFGVNAPTIPIHFVQEKETASYHQYSKLAGTLRAIYGIISDGLNIPFVIGRYDENGNIASRLYLNTDGAVNLSNEKSGANLIIGNDGVLKFKNQEFTYLNQFASSKAVNGWQKLPSGIIFQWGIAPASANGVDVNFPIAFPNMSLYVGAGEVTEASNNWFFAQIASSTKTGFSAQVYGGLPGGTTNAGAQTFKWFSIGY